MLLQVSNLFKVYGQLPVLLGTSLTVEEGKCYGIVGPNGSGKSTLVRILSGLERPDAGEVTIGQESFRFARSKLTNILRSGLKGRGLARLWNMLETWRECRSLRSPRDWLKRGIAVVMQRPTRLLEGNNDFVAEAELGSESRPLERETVFYRLYEEAIEKIRAAGTSEEALYLSRFARALRWRPKVLVLDEITTRLSQKNREWVLQALKRAAEDQNCRLASVLISHDFDEVFGHADAKCRYYFRRGALHLSDASNVDGLRRECFGNPVPLPTPRSALSTRPRFTLLSVKQLGNSDLVVNPGEVKAIWHDSWQSDPKQREDFLCLLETGRLDGSEASLKLSVDGHEGTRDWSPATLVELGGLLVPPDIRDATFGDLSLAENLLYRPPWENRPQQERTWRFARRWATDRAATLVKRARISTPGVWQPLNWLSGGNQHKALLFAALERQPEVLIVVSPFASLDEPARSNCLAALRAEAARGMSILLVVQSAEERDFVESKST